MYKDNEVKQAEKKVEKSPIATGFTPEHELGETYVLNEKKKK